MLRKSNEEYFDIALTPLINCLTHNDEAWRSQHAVGKIRYALTRYVSSCRNDHFHKDNINTKRELDAIRSNTKLAIYYLLGGYNPCNSDDEFLALFDTSLTYDELYSKIRGMRSIRIDSCLNPTTAKSSELSISKKTILSASDPLVKSSPKCVLRP